MKRKTILLDMDGVLVDLVPQVLAHHGISVQYREYPDCRGVYEACQLLKPDFDIPHEDFWNQFSADWWWQLPKTEHCDAIVQKAANLAGLYNIHFCSFAITPESAEGKTRWIRQHFPGLDDRLCLIKHKWLLAQPDYILVDDRCTSCKEFRNPPGPPRKGGESVIVPRPWNELRPFQHLWGEMTLRQMHKVYHHGE